MKRIMMIGMPTHLRVKPKNEIEDFMRSACGVYGRVLDAAYDPRDVNCLRCLKTKEYKYRMHGGKKPC